MVAGSPSASAQMRAWVRERLKQRDTVVIKELSTEMFEHYRGNVQFLEALAKETMPGVITDLVRGVVAETRRSAGLLMIGGKVMPAEAVAAHVDAGVKSFNERLMFHMEYVPSVGHIRLGKMKKFDLLSAANARQVAAESSLKVASLWRHMAERLNDQQSVEEVFTNEEIVNFLSEYKVELTIEGAA